MKPIKLTMRAFGSFAEETTVNFRDFQNGLFLVVGDTGAGKTTIFDAIVFALYGVASGSNRKPEMMHSDYVDKSEKLFVKLEFEQGGKSYTVTRKISFPKKRGKQNEYGNGKVDADLRSPEGTPVEGATKVTARCTELLGLNAEQFRRIVMLAQGEFRKFLSANAEEKSEILGKLFDNSEYVRFQNLLKQSRDALENQRAGYTHTVETQMNTLFQRPESQTPEDEVLYLPGSPDLIANLDRLIAADQEQTTGLEREKQKAQRAVDDINKRRGAAEVNNKLLNELDAAKRHLEALEQRKAEMERQKQEYDRAEKALHQCVPQRDNWEKAKAQVAQTEQAIQNLQQTIRTLEEQCAARQVEVDGDQTCKQRIEEINSGVRELEKSLPQYDELEKTHSKLEQAVERLQTCSGELEQKQTEEEKKKNALTACQSELALLKNAGAEETSREFDYKSAKKAVDDFSKVVSDVETVQQSEKELEQDKADLIALTEKAGAALDEHNRLYRLFIEGQAGVLASELKNDLDETGKGVCPVCHSVFCAGEPHDFAALVEGTPTQDEVKDARAHFDQSEKERSEIKTAVDKKEASLAATRDSILASAKNLLPDCESWEQLSAPNYLAQASAQLNRVKDEAKVRYDAAKKQRQRHTELNDEQERLTEERENLAREIREKTNAISQAKVQIEGLKEKEKALQERLTFACKSEASARLQELDKERGKLQAVIDQHQSALKQATEKLNKTRGGLQEKENTLPKQQAEKREAQSAFISALARNGFANVDEMEAALVPIGREDGETWLNQQHKTLNEYRNDCDNTEKRVAELSEQTKNLSYTNLEELNELLRAAEEKRSAAEGAYSRLDSLLKNHRQVRANVAQAQGELKRTDKAWERLDRLANLAVGVGEGGKSVAGGKLSFERYVMGSIFREVLEMANRRLDIMSGGKYELVHTVKGKQSNSVAGLEIEVLDVTTGKQRAANSLSGGESFQVSLSLALGLSDVVQSHAGGIGLDTVFIDEGFGALDGSALDSAITVLKQLTEGERLVGIISHVDKLEESINQKLRVRKTAQGSELSVELS